MAPPGAPATYVPAAASAGMLDAERRAVADELDRLAALTPGRTGNLSARRGDRFAVTPSGVPYHRTGAEDIPVVDLEGERLAGEFDPSSETPLHGALYDRLGVGAVAHTHSPWATTLAVLGEPVRPVHYMLALAGGEVPVADYATYGTATLAATAVDTMAAADSRACLLANHGLVATGPDAAAAVETAEAVEAVAQLDCQARALGGADPLPEAELDRVADRLEAYGQDG
ncbi:MAG: L-fuculose-phosphate aldolase [Natronomonas sp.]